MGGRVVDATSGGSVEGALVRLAPLASLDVPVLPDPAVPPLDVVMSDAQGRFEFSLIPPGSYLVTATRDGYYSGTLLRTRITDAGKPVTVRDGRTDVRLEMWRTSALTGAVIDASGEPVIGARVTVLRRAPKVGFQLHENTISVLTDDRGVFRAYNLVPSDYIACATFVQKTLPANVFASYHSGTLQIDRHLRRQLIVVGEPVSPGNPAIRRLDELIWFAALRPTTDARSEYQTTCSPATTSFAEAVPERLTAGQVGGPLSIRVIPRPGVRVSGRLTGPNGPAAHTAVRLLARSTLALVRDAGMETALSMTDAAGRFSFFGVPPGEYIVRSSLMASDLANQSQASGLHWLASDLVVGTSDVSELDLVLQRSSQIDGKVIVERSDSGAAPMPALSRLWLTVEPVDGRFVQLTPGTPSIDGSFSIKDLPGGRYVLRAPDAPPGWTLRSATLDGRDIVDDPFELPGTATGSVVATFTNKITDVMVTAIGATGQPEPRCLIWLVPADRRYWTDSSWNARRYRIQRPEEDATLRLQGFPPGSYFVMAISRDASFGRRGIEETFEFVTRTGQRIELAEGAKLQLRLRVEGAR